MQDEVEVFIYVCCWILHVLYIRFGVLGNKTVWFWSFDGSSYHNSCSHCPLLYLQVRIRICLYTCVVEGKDLSLLWSSFVFRCWWYRLTRAGSVILALHDASDVFLEIGKMSKYCGAESLASISFVLFALSWVVLRLIYYPFWILWSTRFVNIPQTFFLNVFLDFLMYKLWFLICSYQIIMTVDKEKHPNGPILYYMFNTLLYFLLVLHIFWWVLIYRMLVKQVQDRGKLSEDVRSGTQQKLYYNIQVEKKPAINVISFLMQILKAMMNTRIDCRFGILVPARCFISWTWTTQRL